MTAQRRGAVDITRRIEVAVEGAAGRGEPVAGSDSLGIGGLRGTS